MEKSDINDIVTHWVFLWPERGRNVGYSNLEIKFSRTFKNTRIDSRTFKGTAIKILKFKNIQENVGICKNPDCLTKYHTM